MALNTRCRSCRHLLGPEDAVGCVTNPALCFECRARSTAMVDTEHPSASIGRQRKALAMARVIDANFIRQFPHLDPYDQAFRILQASWGWTEAIWEWIGENALKPDGEHYEKKEISPATKAEVRRIYQGRATAPIENRRAS
jgi:hypothetical protein